MIIYNANRLFCLCFIFVLNTKIWINHKFELWNCWHTSRPDTESFCSPSSLMDRVWSITSITVEQDSYMSWHISWKLRFWKSWSSQSNTVSWMSSKESQIHVAVSRSMRAQCLDYNFVCAVFCHGKARQNGPNNRFSNWMLASFWLKLVRKHAQKYAHLIYSRECCYVSNFIALNFIHPINLMHCEYPMFVLICFWQACGNGGIFLRSLNYWRSCIFERLFSPHL